MQSDFHMHSTHSPDGHHTPYELCRQAVALDLDAIAITDHVEWSPGGRNIAPDFPRYFADIVVCREEFGSQGLRVLSGVEFGNPHEHQSEVQAFLDDYHFDVVIASIHWVKGQNIHDLRCFSGREPYAVYADYFQTMAEMVASTEFDILAHFDRIFATAVRQFGPPRIDRLEPQIRPVLQELAARGRILELNTRFLNNEPGWNESLAVVLRWFGEEGGTYVALNSDAHRIEEIGRHMEIGETLLTQADLKRARDTSFGVRLSP
jgi:histidinol-phosphatase (PHP family)